MLTTATSNEGHAMSSSPPRPTRRRRTAKTVLASTAITTPLLIAAPAAAAPCQRTSSGIVCSPTHTETGSSGGSSEGGASDSSADWVAPPDFQDLANNQAEGSINPVDPGAPPPAPAVPSTWELVQSALDSAAFPVPTVHTAPDGKTYVRMETTLWVDGFTRVQTDPVSAGDQTVVATAEPVSVTWSLGEKKLVCNNAGSRNSDSCTYTYQRSSAGQPGGSYKITATIAWDVSWACEGLDCDDAGGSLGQETRTSAPTPLVVGEIQTNTGS